VKITSHRNVLEPTEGKKNKQVNRKMSCGLGEKEGNTEQGTPGDAHLRGGKNLSLEVGGKRLSIIGTRDSQRKKEKPWETSGPDRKKRERQKAQA